jgi:hypothetical protein
MKTVFALRRLAFVAAVGLLPVLLRAQAAKPVTPDVTTPTQTTTDTGDLVVPVVKFPMLPKMGINAAAFTPAGWVLRQQASGDLNGDGKPDLVLLFADTDPHNIVQDVDTNPYLLAIAFANADGSGYTLAAQNTSIPRETDTRPNPQGVIDDPTCSDCTGNLKIARGAFKLIFDNTNLQPGNTNFTFRFQHNQFELIGYEDSGVDGGVTYDTSWNFSTWMEQDVRTPVDSDKPKTKLTKLAPKPLLTFTKIDLNNVPYY